MKYRLLLIKRLVEDIVMFPMIVIGRLIAKWKPLPNEYAHFYFFPFYHTGGAEKVHALVAKATGKSNCIIFFTRKSHNKGFVHLFEETGCEIKDVSKYTDNKWIYFVNIIFRGIISGYINRQVSKPIVFNGQCNFGYKISPWINNSIPQIELIHSVSNFSYIRMPFLPFISKTVMISTIKINEHLAIYKRYGVPLKMGERISFIMNAIDLPSAKPLPKKIDHQLTVLYVGRSTPEKRVDLIAQIAKLVKEKESSIVFQFLGDVQEAIPKELQPYCTFFGNRTDAAVINDIYNQADVLILLSDTEGFPMVVMEAMARGLAIIATGVGELPLHIKDGISGFIIKDYRNEQTVISSAEEHIFHLFQNKDLFHSISAYNVEYAYRHFGMDRFTQEYCSLFEEIRQHHSTI